MCALYVCVNFSRPSAKLLQSQLSTQLESSEHSDSSEELPPTPPNQLFLPAVKKVNKYVQKPTAQRVASHSSQQLASPTAGGTSSSSQQLASPTARGTSPTCEAMFTKLLTVLEEVKETQRVHGKMLNALLKKQDGSVVEVPEGVVLPLKTQADLEALDQKLSDRSLMSDAVSLH